MANIIAYHGAGNNFATFQSVNTTWSRAKGIPATFWFTDTISVAYEYSVRTRVTNNNIDYTSYLSDNFLCEKIGEYRRMLVDFNYGKSKGIPLNDFIDTLKMYTNIHDTDIQEIENTCKNGYITTNDYDLFRKLSDVDWYRPVLEYLEHVADLNKMEAALKNSNLDGRIIKKCSLMLNNPLIIDKQNYGYSSKSELEKIVKAAKGKGHDGVIVKNIKDGGKVSTHYAIFDAAQIDILDTIGWR